MGFEDLGITFNDVAVGARDVSGTWSCDLLSKRVISIPWLTIRESTAPGIFGALGSELVCERVALRLYLVMVNIGKKWIEFAY